MSNIAPGISRRRLLQSSAVLVAGTIATPFATSSGPVHAQPGAWQGAQVSSVGFTQVRDGVYVGFTLTNPNADVTLVDLECESIVADANGTVLKTTSEYLEWVAPQQTLVIADTTFIPSGSRAGNVTVQVKRQAYRPNQDFILEDVRFVEERFSSSATATVRNPFPLAFSDLRVYAIFYDSTDTPIGGNSTFLSKLPALGTAVVRISVPEGIRPARISMSATFTSITKYGE